MARLSLVAFATAFLASCGSETTAPHTQSPSDDREWLAGDHHIHTEWSMGWDEETNPPTPIRGGGAKYSIQRNAEEAIKFGLDWIVITDHGGPNHSQVNREQAYPELVLSRAAFPELMQFWGMEFDTPAAEHTTLLIPHTHDEEDVLFELESRFAAREPWPKSEQRTEERTVVDALIVARDFSPSPLFIVNHPSRTAPGLNDFGKVEPRELRTWNDTAPHVAVGMAGAPGHQANAIKPFGISPTGTRGSYRQHPTYGGFDQMTAIVGGFWDSMLGEGRRWWITANSDSHVHWSEGGSDFWPGEYSKTYVFAEKNHESLIEAIRAGHVFVTLGDLIAELSFSANTQDGMSAMMGDTLTADRGADVTLNIRVRHSETPNANGDEPRVARVDVITGQIQGPITDANTSENTTANVSHRLTHDDWQEEGQALVMSVLLEDVRDDMYIRIRGTNTDQLEPAADPQGENPWEDLWFYSNPIFIDVAPFDDLHPHSHPHGSSHHH